jgi:hypothetical protein
MPKVSDLLRQGRRAEVWTKYCGFLDLGLDHFLDIQKRLLTEQLQLAGRSELGRYLMGDDPPRDVDEFRKRMRLTTYKDYAPFLDEQRDDVLPEKPVAWAHTSGRSGRYKWVPITARALTRLGEGALAQVLLATAHRRGEVRLEPNDVAVYNVAGRPYITGYATLSMAELFQLRCVPPVEKMEAMSFQDRIQSSFQIGLRTGIDIIGSISSVLVKVGEQFGSGVSGAGFSPALLHPAVLFRLGRGLVRSRLEGRQLLPKDLWQVKAIIVGGTDTAIYRQRLVEDWGVEPHESYGCTEAVGPMAVQTWSGEGLYFLPDACFYEFIPEADWAIGRDDPSHIPQTVLLDEVEAGERYEIIITSFYGGSFLRYRLHDLVRFVSLQDEQAGIDLPSIVFSGRDQELIDLAGFTGLIDEKFFWQAIADTGIGYEEWAVRKEQLGLHAGLHLYIELKEALSAEEVAEAVHQALVSLNPFYKDLVRFLGIRPVHVTLLPPGTFRRYMSAQHAAGADMAHLKPPHMNAPDEVIEKLLRAGEELAS